MRLKIAFTHPVGASDSSQSSSQMHEHTALLLSRITEASPQAAIEVNTPGLYCKLCSVTASLLFQCVPVLLILCVPVVCQCFSTVLPKQNFVMEKPM